jgi:hypothetical protein
MLSMCHGPDSFSLKVGADSELDRLSDKRDEFCSWQIHGIKDRVLQSQRLDNMI